MLQKVCKTTLNDPLCYWSNSLYISTPTILTSFNPFGQKQLSVQISSTNTDSHVVWGHTLMAAVVGWKVVSY